MHLLIDDMNEICEDTVRSVLGQDLYSTLESKLPDAIGELIDRAEIAWLIWIFRAMVFNRSVIFVEHGTKARPLIPAKWLGSQLPVHIS